MSGLKYKYLRISVTDRCDLACIYCKAECGLKRGRKSLLTFEEIANAVDLLTNFGITNIRLTGGEPLIRKDLPRLIEMLSNIPAIETLALTTNGTNLAKEASDLKLAGLDRINVHIDTLDEEKYRWLTCGGKLYPVLKGIEAALSAGVDVKLNTVLLRGISYGDVRQLINFAAKLDIPIRFIELMPFCSAEFYKEHFISIGDVFSSLLLEPVPDKFGSGPASYYKEKNTGAVIGLIAPISRKFCSTCDRLRLTSDGHLRKCLADGDELDLKGYSFNRSVIQRYLLGKDYDHRVFKKIAAESGMRAFGG